MRGATLLLAAAMIVVISAAAAANVLVNRDFENPVHTTGWNLNGIAIEQYPNAWLVPGPCPADPNGPWGLQVVNNYGISSGTATQRVDMTGLYSLTGSGWFRLYSGVGQGVSIAELRLLVDGVLVQSQSVSGINGAWTDWVKIQLPTWTGQVNSNVRLRAYMQADGMGGWGQVVGDYFTLDAVLIPEPAGMLALCFGAGGLLLRRRR